MSANTLAGIALIAFIGITLYFNALGQPASTIKDRVVVHEVEPPNLHFYKTDKDGVGKLIIKDRKTGTILGDFAMDERSVMYTPKDYKGDLEASFLSDYYMIDPGLDLGCFGGIAYTKSDDPFQVGIRVSPVRLLYGTLAPDVLLTKSYIGLGASVYGPKRYLPYGWMRHIGLGAYYCTPLDKELDPALLLGLTMSTKF
jgi:hypothetical protein